MYAVCPECNEKFAEGVKICPRDAAPLLLVQDEEVDALVGTTIAGRYHIRSLIKRGGMGKVYLAVQTSVAREVAIKVMLPEVGRDEAAVKRFYREAKIVAHLASPHVVAVHEFGQTDDGTLFIAMELVRGTPLSEVIAGGPMPVSRVKRIVSQVCQALAAAHAQGIVHRDLKPDNIMILQDQSGEDFVKVLDFGIAKLSSIGDSTMGESDVTRSGTLLGTPTYMSPEQVEARHEVTAQADLYTLSIIAFEMLAGRPPFEAPTPITLLLMHANSEPPLLRDRRPDVLVPDALQQFLRTNMSKDPANRAPSAGAYRRDFLTACGSSLFVPLDPLPAAGADAPTSEASAPALSAHRWYRAADRGLHPWAFLLWMTALLAILVLTVMVTARSRSRTPAAATAKTPATVRAGVPAPDAPVPDVAIVAPGPAAPLDPSPTTAPIPAPASAAHDLPASVTAEVAPPHAGAPKVQRQVRTKPDRAARKRALGLIE